MCKANSENIKFEYEYPPHDVSFPLKEYEYASVISNLLDNAFEAPCNKEKIVKLTIGTENERNFIKVVNNGELIPADLIPKLFKKGYSTKEKKSGHGFGLYNIKKITKSYGGSIEVYEEGEFTVFNICFDEQKRTLVPQS